MREHHERAIRALRELYEPDPRYLALIIVGSVAAGAESETSDVDHILVATDEEYARRRAAEAIHYCDRDFCDYPGGYVEGKVVDRGFIEEAAARGSEPARSQFVGAKVVFSKVHGLAETVARIPVYPDAGRAKNIRSFYAHMMVLRGYLDYGLRKGDHYVVLKAAGGVALFGGRLILAHNRILYPYHKWFMREVWRAPEKPSGFDALLEAFVTEPTIEHCDAFCRSVIEFMDLERDPPPIGSRFVMDTEWEWRDGGGSVEDW